MKNNKPIIGIVGRCHLADSGMKIICISENYRKAVVKCGGIPLLILPTQNLDYIDVRPADMPKLTEEEIVDLKAQVDLCDGLIFPGGQRIYEYAYEIFDYAYEKDMPILGTCLGMQTIASARNNRNSRELLTKVETNILHRQMDEKWVHKMKIKKDSKLFEIIGKEEFMVNSKHTYCISEAPNLEEVGYSEDGILEAIEDKNKKFVIGVQWHPEELWDEDMEKIMKALIDASKNK